MARRLVVFSLISACGGHPAGPSAPSEPPVALSRFALAPPLVTPGEHMTYRLSLMGAELATFDLAVGESRVEVAGKPTIIVQTHAKVSGIGELAARAAGIHVDDTFTSWIDVTTGRPLHWYCDEYARKSADKERSEARLAERSDDRIPIVFHVNDGPPKDEPQTVSMPDVWDYNAFLIALRSWEGAPGSTISAEVLRSRFLWHVDMKIRGRETLYTALGDFPALRLDGHTYKLGRDGHKLTTTEERDFSIWISDDDGRVPLEVKARTDYGAVEMDIIDYNPGTGKRLRQ